MFVMDMPDVPPQYAPIVIAQASQAQKGDAKTERTIGVCHLIQNPPVPPQTAVNSLSPLGSVHDYFSKVEHREVGLDGKVTVLQGPEHGELGLDEGTQSAAYFPTDPNYRGPDRATLLVEIGGYKVKVMYFFKVGRSSWSGTDEGDPYDDKKNCPNGPVWNISLNPDDPNADLITFQNPAAFTSYLAQTIKVNLNFADLAGEAVGESQGNIINLDTDAV